MRLFPHRAARAAPRPSKRRSIRLEVESLEDRLVPSWAGVPPSTISPPGSAVQLTLNNGGDASGTAAISSTEVDYYTFVAPTTGSYRFDATTPSSNLDTVLGVFNSSGQRIGYNDDISSSNYDSRVTLNLTAGQRYYFGITNYTGTAAGSYSWLVDGPAALVDDGYEQNDSFAAAYNLGTLSARRTIGGLAMADSADWYRFTMNGTGTSAHYVQIDFTHASGNLALALYNSSGQRLALVNGTGNSERISLNGRAGGTYYIQVYGVNGAFNPSYSLDINPPAVVSDDGYEQNDSQSAAYNLGTLTAQQTVSGLIMADSADWFRFTMNGTGTTSHSVQVNFAHASGDLDLGLYNSSGQRIGLSDGTTNSEQISLNGLAAGTYYVHVYGYNGVFNPSYSLVINPAIATPPPPPPPTGSEFQITLSFSGLTASQITIFNQAAARWSQVITGDLPNATYNGQAVDDVLIAASVVNIDGVGGVLGQAGPDYVRGGSYLPIHGAMEFDSADMAWLEQNNQLYNVILHEMGHVLGIGTIWSYRGLVTGAGTSNSMFVGAQAVAAYNSIFGVNASGVPLETSMGPGSNDSHWRESLFGNELMSPVLNSNSANPLSRITIASLADLGYVVNMNAADAYTRPAAIVAQTTTSANGNGRGSRLMAGDLDIGGEAVGNPAFGHFWREWATQGNSWPIPVGRLAHRELVASHPRPAAAQDEAGRDASSWSLRGEGRRSANGAEASEQAAEQESLDLLDHLFALSE